MALSMKERNDEKAWAAYEKDAKKLMKEAMGKREKISDRHRNDPPGSGLGISPEAKEARELSKWYGEELKKLQTRHGIR